jgi:hypothetical protein
LNFQVLATIIRIEFACHMIDPTSGLATFRRKIDVFGRTVNGFGRAKTAGLPAVFFEGLW